MLQKFDKILRKPSTENQVLTIFFALFLGIVCIDVYYDSTDNVPFYHYIFEILIATLALCGFLFFYRKAWITKLRLTEVESTSLIQKQELSKITQNYQQLNKGIHDAIDQQLGQWGLTTAEKDICILVLKGFSNHEIANLRNTSENTIKQQSSSIYMKANVKGRNELSAFFIEEVLNSKPKN